MRVRLPVIVILLACWWPRGSAAHEPLADRVDRVSAAIEDAASVDLLLRRADLHRVDEDWEAALADIRAAERAGASPWRTSLLRGLVQLESGHPARAHATLTLSLRARETFSARWYRGRTLIALGRPDAALRDYDRAIELGSGLDAFVERGRLLEARGAWRAAADNYRRALREVGDSGVLRERLFEAELAAGQFDRASRAVAPLIDRLPVRTRWLLMRAKAHERAGRPGLARRDREHALADARRALSKRRSPLLLVERARAHAALGHDAAALRDVDEALARAPHFEAARRLRSQLGLRGTP